MSLRKQHRSLALSSGITVIVGLVLACAGCERDTTIDMDRKIPPTFKLSGNGQVSWIEFTDLSPSDISVYAPERVIWKITPTGQNTPWRLPKITYGVVPSGFSQEIPASGAPPSLVEEKPYSVSAPTSNANTGSMIFLIRGGQALRVIQTHNGEYYLENSDVFR
jgi:hypothetical protein